MRISNFKPKNRRRVFLWPALLWSVALLVLLASASLGRAQGKC